MSGTDVVMFAYCPEHGLHGARTECFVCGGEVEQVPMVPAAEYEVLVDLEAAVRRCVFYNLPENEPPEGDSWHRAWEDAGHALARLDATRDAA